MEEQIVHVKMADMNVVRGERQLKTILGSCVGVILRDPERKVSGLAHIMLPGGSRRDAAQGKYADTAIPGLLALIVHEGGRHSSLEALLVGGAQMFPLASEKVASIGEQNVQASRSILARNHIPIVFEDTGGLAGRSVVYDNTTGSVSVRTLRTIGGKESA